VCGCRLPVLRLRVLAYLPAVSTADILVRLTREGLLLALVLSAPVVLSALLVGLFVSVVQATTQIQEQTLSFAPKLVAVMLALAITGPWIGAQLVRFTTALFDVIPRIT
jgi:flagellar biosynthesis protein FliQ